MKFSQDIIMNANEAAAWAAISSGLSLVSHYPGSPVNFIEKHIQKLNDRFDCGIKINNAINEHVAALVAAGASYCGARSMVIMKHVGLNIAADPFNYLGYTGIKGGMVIVVGTDAGANSSTGEEDVHWYVPQFNFPLFEPTSVQECYTYSKRAFELSEKYEIPVLLFMPGRLANSYSSVKVEVINTKERPRYYFEKNIEKYINVGQQAVRNHKALLDKVERISQKESFVKEHFNLKASIGLIVRGMTYASSYELIEKYELQDDVHLLNLGLVYPIPHNAIVKFLKNKDEIIFIEDQDGFLELQIKMNHFANMPREVSGKDVFPKYGEISVDQIESFFLSKFDLKNQRDGEIVTFPEVPERLGSFCEGCPHRGSFYAIDTALKDIDGIIGGDIGCSSLPPYRADWLLCMNAGIGISQGMAQLDTGQTVISTGGDGSFFHAGALSLMNAVQNKIDFIHVVFDNETIAMTGHQDSLSSNNFDHRKFLESMGVDKVIDVWAYDPKDFTKKIKEEIKGKGVRVFWVKGACILAGNQFVEDRREVFYPEIDASKCNTCSKCYKELACPAIINLKEAPHQLLNIDLDKCVRCGICNEICPNGAITIKNVL